MSSFLPRSAQPRPTGLRGITGRWQKQTSKQNRESLLPAAGRHHQTLKGQPCTASCLPIASKHHGELPARAWQGEQQLPLPVPGSPVTPERGPVQVPQTHPTGPHLPLYSSPFSVSELKWEFDWYLKHPLRQTQTPPPLPTALKALPLVRVTSLPPDASACKHAAEPDLSYTQ